jgi:dTDP-4-dehydrorhamnose reductase
MKLLVTGSKGQVGWELQNRAASRGMAVVGVDIEDIDIADKQSVEKVVGTANADLVVNAAAYTAVDAAEGNAELAFKVNRDGPANLALACRAAKMPLIHISTDYVYGGDRKGAYLEDDPVAPLGIYAQSKAGGDQAVSGILAEHIILRTAWVYGVHGHNFVKTMLRLGKEREQLSVVADQAGCPTDAADLADAILDIVRQVQQGRGSPWGIYHFCGGGQTTWYGFAREIFKLAGQYDSFIVKSVAPVGTSAYPTPVRRPANSVLDCSKIARAFDIVPRPWEKSLADMLRRLYLNRK